MRAEPAKLVNPVQTVEIVLVALLHWCGCHTLYSSASHLFPNLLPPSRIREQVLRPLRACGADCRGLRALGRFLRKLLAGLALHACGSSARPCLAWGRSPWPSATPPGPLRGRASRFAGSPSPCCAGAVLGACRPPFAGPVEPTCPPARGGSAGLRPPRRPPNLVRYAALARSDARAAPPAGCRQTGVQAPPPQWSRPPGPRSGPCSRPAPLTRLPRLVRAAVDLTGLRNQIRVLLLQ